MDLITITIEGMTRNITELPSLGKFVVCKKDTNFFLALFVIGFYHSDIAQRLTEKELEFVGAGIFQPAYDDTPSNAYFESRTCAKAFGFDRPVDPNLAQEILDSIVKILTEISLRPPAP